MAAAKKEKNYLVTYGVCFDKPRHIEHVSVTYTDDGKQGANLVQDIKKHCKAHAIAYITKGEIHRIWIHFMLLLGLSLLFICPTFANNPSPAWCMSDWNTTTTKVGRWTLRDNDACFIDVTYANRCMKKVYTFENEVITYYVDDFGREAVTVNGVLKFGNPYLLKQL